MNKSIKKAMITMMFFFFVLLLSPVKADDEPYIYEPLEDKPCSLTLYLYADDEESCIEGAELSLIKMAEIKEENGQYYYSFIEKFKEYEEKFDLGSSDVFKDPEFAAAVAEDSPEILCRSTSNNLGKISFDNLSAGLYVVIQTGKNGKALDYESYSPFIVNLPELIENDESNLLCWNYDAEAYPKTEVKKEEQPEAPPTHPTGDDADIPLCIIMMLSALVLFIGITGSRRKTDEY